MENDCFAMLEKFLGESSYIAGNEMTIADFSIASTLSNINVSSHYMNVKVITRVSKMF